MDSPQKENDVQSDLLVEGAMEGMNGLEDEAMFSMSKMVEFIRSGSDSQRTILLFELPQLLDRRLNETFEELVPVLCEEVKKWREDLQLSAAEAILDVVQQELNPRIANIVCTAAFEVLQNSKSTDMFEAWGEILVIVLPSVRWTGADEVSHLVKVLDGFVRAEEEVCRKLAARVLGSVSTCLKAEDVEEHILQRALQLANDEDMEVRGMVAESLAFVGAVVSLEKTEQVVWPTLVTLLHDSDARIHAATLRTISHLLEAHREDHSTSALFQTLLPPIFAEECAFARKAAGKDQRSVDDDTYLLLEIVAEVFGSFIISVHPFFESENEKKEAYKAFMAMATCNGPIVRRYCAFNIPAVSKCLSKGFANELSGVVEFLSRDPDSETRWNLAAGIHETTAILMGKGSSENLFRAVTALLQDENPLVRMNTLEHFFSLLTSLAGGSDLKSAGKLTTVFQNLTLLSEGNWRTQELLANQLERASSLVPVECLRVNVLPLLYIMAEESTYLVRKAAMPAIAKAIWCIPSPRHREEVMKSFSMEWGNGGVYWMRIAYIECAHAALKVFSSELFRNLFAPTLFRLAQDNVANVRLRLAKMVHEMAAACRKCPDFREVIDMLREDTDADVRDAICGVEERMRELLGDVEEIQKTNEARERAEEELETLAEQKKGDARKRAPKTKLGKSVILPRLNTKANLNVTQTSKQATIENLSSPISATSTPKGNERTPVMRLSGFLQSPKSKLRESKDSGFLEGDEVSQPSSAGRKALRLLLGRIGSGRRRRQNVEDQ